MVSMNGKIPELLDQIEQGKKTARKLADKRDRLLAELKAQGFGSFEELDRFLSAAETLTGKTKKRAASRPAKKAVRSRTTDKDRTRAIELLKEGKTTKEVAKAIGKSMATVQNLKKEAGLVKKAVKRPSKSVAKTA
jgi:DNA-binding NarL/FixJ family response regulator